MPSKYEIRYERQLEKSQMLVSRDPNHACRVLYTEINACWRNMKPGGHNSCLSLERSFQSCVNLHNGTKKTE